MSRSPRRGPSTAPGSVTRLDVVLWSGPATAELRLTLHLPPSLSDPPAPGLLAAADHVCLAVGVNAARSDTLRGASGPVSRTSGHALIRYLESPDGGLTWPASAAVLPERPAGDRDGPSRVVALAVAVSEEQRSLVFSGYGVYAARSADGRRWTAPRRLAGYSTGFSRESAESEDLTVAPLAGGGHGLAWIDARFRQSDRRWWNPLGGFPWADDTPLWRNNDVFFAALPAAAPDDDGGHLEVRRLTRTPAHARDLALELLPGRTVLLWAGRSRVGRALNSFGAHPALFHAVLEPR